MIDSNTESNIVISCGPHITNYLKAEVESLGYAIEGESVTSVSLKGTFEDCIKLNLQLFTASHVFLEIRKFACDSLDQLFAGVKAIEWELIMEEEGYFSIHSYTDHPSVTNTMFLNMKVKDAIVDRFNGKLNIRPYSGSDKSKTVFFVFWKNSEAIIYLDTTGESLTKHGYRKLSAKAPLQESLAAAMLLSTRWDRKSTVINPMCGGGTLAIEAAMLAIGKPPGLIRENFGFRHFRIFSEVFFMQIKNGIESKVLRSLPFGIIATDSDEHTLSAARKNAKLAGVDHLIEFSNCDFSNTPVPEVMALGVTKNGIVIFNPPYGERLGAEEELEATYKEIGDFLKKKCAGYSGYVLTANPSLAKNIGLKPKSKKVFFNGKLECRLLEYEMYQGSRKPAKPAAD